MIQSHKQLKDQNKRTSTPRQTNNVELRNPDLNQDRSNLREKRSNTIIGLKEAPIPSTPSYRSSKRNPPSARLFTRWTPRDYTRTPSALKRAGFLHKPIALTPHGRAARRELNLRSGMTPAAYRRKIGQNQQRKTPRDDLRALSRILAAKSQGSKNLEVSSLSNGNEEEDEDIPLTRPRLSLALRKDDDDEDDDDDNFLLPPQSSNLEEENLTIKSIELPRRDASENFTGLSRGSFGSTRISDFFSELSETRSKYDADESSYMINIKKDNHTLLPPDDQHLIEESQTLNFTTEVADTHLPMNHESDIEQENFVANDNDTFVLTVPSREVAEGNIKSNDATFPLNFEVDEFLENEELSNDDDLGNQLFSTLSNDSFESNVINNQNRDKEFPETRHVRKKLKLSRYGIAYPSLPISGVKKLATTFAKTAGISKPTLNKKTVDAIQQATDWFFEQVSDDLRAYANHAGRKTIDESDVITLMRR